MSDPPPSQPSYYILGYYDESSYQPFHYSQLHAPSCHRFPVSADNEFPDVDLANCGRPTFRDADGKRAVYIGSACSEDGSIHPCTIIPEFHVPRRIPYAGKEIEHSGR